VNLRRRSAQENVTSAGRQAFDEQLAVAIDSQPISVPQIDSKLYPNGIQAHAGAELDGNLVARPPRCVTGWLFRPSSF
jgi:hypothetical protein